MKTTRLTERNMADKRFKRTEQAIFIAYYKIRDYPSAKKLSKRAGISRSTFYRHHQTTNSIPSDYEEYLLAVFSRKIKKRLNNSEPNLKNSFLRLLVFIMNNKEVYKALFGEGRKDIIKKMLLLFKSKVVDSWDAAGNLDHIFNIYGNEILALIESWSEESFANEKITVVLNAIMYLTNISYRNLLPLKKLTKDQGGQARP